MQQINSDTRTAHVIGKEKEGWEKPKRKKARIEERENNGRH
jgi:hypothetical protein